MNNTTKELNFKTKTIPLVKETLRTMPLNESMRVKSKTVKQSVIRAAIAKLNNEGYNFNATEAGLVDEIIITRIK